MMATTMLAIPLTAGATDAPKASSSETTATTTTTTTAEEPGAVQPTSQVAVGGTVVKNELPGAFQVAPSSAVAGVAVRQTAATIKQAAGLAANETPFVKAFTVDRKKSAAVYASFDAAAATVGGTTLGGINVDLGKLTGGKYTTLPAGVTVPITIGIKNFDANRTYYVVKVLPGGAIEMIPVTIENGKATFNISGGLAGYGLIVK